MVKNHSIEEQIRVQAYYLWVADGRPDGRSEEFWEKARSMHRKLNGQSPTIQEQGVPVQIANDAMDETPQDKRAAGGRAGKTAGADRKKADPAKRNSKPSAAADSGPQKREAAKQAEASSAPKKQEASSAASKTALAKKTKTTRRDVVSTGKAKASAKA
jgi:hypothetical protein